MEDCRPGFEAGAKRKREKEREERASCPSVEKVEMWTRRQPTVEEKNERIAPRKERTGQRMNGRGWVSPGKRS